MKLTVLIENTTSSPELVPEHGFSLYIETPKHNILFDMGRSDAFVGNAERLGVDLSKVDVAILSHGHHDHGGGLKRFLEINDKASVYLSSHAFEPHYNISGKYNGLDCELQKSDRLIYVEERFEIDEALSLFSCNERVRPVHTDNFGQTIKVGNELLPDPFIHEQYLVVREEGRTVLFSGCSHKGILNIAHWFKPDILVGGFHFSKIDSVGCGKSCLLKMAGQLLQYPTKYYTGHCTGIEQYRILQEVMGERLNYLSTGSIVQLPECL